MNERRFTTGHENTYHLSNLDKHQVEPWYFPLSFFFDLKISTSIFISDRLVSFKVFFRITSSLFRYLLDADIGGDINVQVCEGEEDEQQDGENRWVSKDDVIFERMKSFPYLNQL